MSAGVLQFSLGLTAGGFLGVLDRATSKVGTFSQHMLSLPGLGAALGGTIASVSSLHAVVEGVFEAIERGAALEHLSKRTQTSVQDLFTLQKGFKAVGLSADDVGPTIFRMQKALGGVNEYGEDTKSVFHSMGLSVEDLRKKKTPEQLLAIASAIRRLNVDSAAKAAGSIFGREGAANMIQLANSTTDFQAAMAKAAADAALFQRNAESFAKLERGLNQIKSKTQTLFAGMAEGAAPAIQAIIDKLNKIDLSGVGRQLGDIFLAVTQAFSEGSFTELLILSIKTGFQIGFASIPPLLEKLGYALLKMFETPLIYFQAGLEYVIQKGMEGISKIPGLNKLTGLENFKSQSFDEVLKDRKAEGLKFFTEDFGLGDIKSDSDNRWNEFLKSTKQISAPLRAMVSGLVERGRKDTNETAPEDKSGKLALGMSNKRKFEGTDFEKMGFVMGGGGNPFKETNDILRQIAANTRKGGPMPPAAPMTNLL